MNREPPSPKTDFLARDRMAWQLATESIVVRIRWLGIAVGLILVHSRSGLHNPAAVQAILALGAVYAILDTYFQQRGEVFLEKSPLFVSVMEAVFISLLCYNDTGWDSPFRWYFLLSLICVSIRYDPFVAWCTFALDCLSLVGVTYALGPVPAAWTSTLLTAVILAWTVWATSALSSLLKAIGNGLREANSELLRHRLELEQRVSERTEALRATQARAIHQEKMAAFGLLAAGIAHEVGNPLAALSSLVQILRRRNPDSYTTEKLDLAGRQLDRIQRTIRELIDFSRPASLTKSRVSLSDVVEEALGIAKYYQRTKQREIHRQVPPDLPAVRGVRDHLTQVLLNLILNAVDATNPEGLIRIEASHAGLGEIALRVIDNGKGVALDDQHRLFQPYFTTKPQGTGLGLFLSRQIVEEHGGTLEFAPAQPAGSAFTIILPVANLVALPPPETSRPTQAASPSPALLEGAIP